MFDERFLARFWAKIDIPLNDDGTPNADACWLWTGARTRGTAAINRYGSIKLNGGKRTIRAHRVALAVYSGEMPADKHAAHSPTCASTLCCNGRHLSWETFEENSVRDLARRHGSFRERLGRLYAKRYQQA